MENISTISTEDRNKDPPRKRLLTHINPNLTFITASPESTVSSDSSSDRFVKKTRELPNLSDCHGCGVRINYTNPRERLQLMDSMWRIVLLCKKCSKRVNSSKLCTYCFSAIVDVNECLKCCDCLHCIHKDCVARYGPRLGRSFVCVDCWVPDGFGKLVRVRKRRFRVGENECREQAAGFVGSRVSVGESVERKLRVKGVDRKVVVALKAIENGVQKVEVAKNTVGFDKGVSSVVTSRNVAGGCGRKAVDDVKLAFLLRRASKSSLRVSRNACLAGSLRRADAILKCYSRRRASKKVILMNSCTLSVPLMCYSRKIRKGCFRNSASLNVPLVCYSRRRSGVKACLHGGEFECGIRNTSEKPDEQVSTSSADLKACILGSSSDNTIGGNTGQGNDEGRITMKPRSILLKYYRIGKGASRPFVYDKNLDCSYMDSANLYTEGMPDARNFRDGNHETCEKSDHNTDRFLLKYQRTPRSKPEFSCKTEEFSSMLPANHPLESTTSSS